MCTFKEYICRHIHNYTDLFTLMVFENINVVLENLRKFLKFCRHITEGFVIVYS